jgi:hypothetical protein
MKTALFFGIALVALVAFAGCPAMAASTQMEGTVQGFTCVTQGKTCPVGKEDPIIAAERLFVVLATDGSYYFVPNLDRAVMARHIRQKVRVTGAYNQQYKALTATAFEVWRDGNWETTWTTELQAGWDKEISKVSDF